MKNKKGYTLLERLVVIGVIVIILRVIYPFLMTSSQYRKKLTQVTIIETYEENRFGEANGTTVVQLQNGVRKSLIGILGKAGEKIKVFQYQIE